MFNHYLIIIAFRSNVGGAVFVVVLIVLIPRLSSRTSKLQGGEDDGTVEDPLILPQGDWNEILSAVLRCRRRRNRYFVIVIVITIPLRSRCNPVAFSLRSLGLNVRMYGERNGRLVRISGGTYVPWRKERRRHQAKKRVFLFTIICTTVVLSRLLFDEIEQKQA